MCKSNEQNKPGWQLLVEAAERMPGENDRKAMGFKQKCAITEAFVTQCEARTGELIPEKHLTKVLDSVMQAACRLYHSWPRKILSFLLSQTDVDTIKEFLSRQKDWEIRQKSTEPSCDDVLIVDD